MRKWLTTGDVKKFVQSLDDPEYAKVYEWAQNELLIRRDTLDPEWQLASAIADAFARECARYNTEARWMRDDLNEG